MANTSVSTLSGLLGYCVLVQETEMGMESGVSKLRNVEEFRQNSVN